MTITHKQLKYMTLPNCVTCHSAQGTTIYEPFTIFDSNIAYTDRRWIYTAVTRATDFKNISIFEHSESECDALLLSKIKQYFTLKIKNYIEQDMLAGRVIKTKQGDLVFKNKVIQDYVDYDWIKGKGLLFCYICGEQFEYELIDGKVHSNMTIDRLDNANPHTKSNCKICCLHCNCSKK